MAGLGTDPTTLGMPASLDPSSLDELEFHQWMKLFMIASTAEEILASDLDGPKLQILFELYPIMMENILAMDFEEIALEPSKIAVRLNRIASVSLDRNQAMRRIGETVKKYATCE